MSKKRLLESYAAFCAATGIEMPRGWTPTPRQIGLRLKRRPSINWLVNQTPLDGCLLVFNARSNSWRTEVSELELLHCQKISDAPVGRTNHNASCDLYIYPKE